MIDGGQAVTDVAASRLGGDHTAVAMGSQKTLLLSLAVADRLSLREEGQQMDAVALDDTQRRRPTT